LCYNKVMLKKISKVMIGSAGTLAVGAAIVPHFVTIHNVSAETTTFQVNVKESLSVSVTTPSAGNWASGDVDNFLRNKVNVSVTSNNANGFKASMYADDTNLTNASNNTYTLATLASGTTWTRSNTSTTNFWAYSLDDDSAAGTYNPVTTSANPVTLLSSSSAASGSKDVYFGAKADMSQASGTYTGTVIINVVTGTIDDDQPTPSNPTVPTDPATPNSSNEVAEYNAAPIGDTTAGSTTYTYRRTSGSGTSTVATTTTQVSDGDNTSSYEGYTPPQGVIDTEYTTTNVSDGSTIANGLAITSAVAATSGLFFFILAKRKEDDDEEEEQ